jgi:hypothetical protein
MSRSYKGKDRQVRIRSVKRRPVDIRKLGAAILALARAQAEAEAEAEHRKQRGKHKSPREDRARSGDERRAAHG